MAQFYTLEEAARVLGMSPEELKLKAQQREVRAFLDGGSWRFRVADVDELARRRGMGSDPDLSLSDLDLEVPGGSESGSGDIDLSEFQLGVATPDLAPPSLEMKSADRDVLLSDMALPPGGVTGSSSTIIGMKPAGKRPSDSDVKLVPEVSKGASDSDVRLKGPGDSDVRLVAPMPIKPPSDSDVTLIADETGVHSPTRRPKADGGGKKGPAVPTFDPGETTLRPSPLLGSSEEVEAASPDSDSDFELTPSSVIDALQPESGSDFELTALDQSSDEFEATPERGPGDSDVTGFEPSASGVNLARPSDSGINLQAVGGLNLSDADSIELAPLEEDEPKRGQPAPKKPAKPAKPAAPKPVVDDSSATALPGQYQADLSATALPGQYKPDLSATALPGSFKADPSATALPMKKKSEKDIFEDTDFEVEALDSGHDDRTVQLDASSDFDLEESDSGSEVFALDEEDVDQNAATALGPSSIGTDEVGEFDESGEPVSGETDSAWGDIEGEEAEAPPTPSTAGRAAAAAPSPAMAAAGPGPEWGGLWVSLLGVTTFFMLLLAFVGMDLVANLYEIRGSNPVSFGLVKSLAGLMPWGS